MIEEMGNKCELVGSITMQQTFEYPLDRLRFGMVSHNNIDHTIKIILAIIFNQIFYLSINCLLLCVSH